jgi:hypothetical protein
MKPFPIFPFFFFLLSVLPSSAASKAEINHPIVILISPPRSLSTAFLRMMAARGDYHCFNEYFTLSYAYKTAPQVVENWLRPHSPLPQTFETIKTLLNHTAKTSPVFVKEQSFPMLDFLSHDDDFVAQKNVYLIFLMRNPHDCIISYYRGLNHRIIEHLLPWLGFEAAYKTFKIAQQKAYNKPLILKAEDLCNQPEMTTRLLCNYLTIPFKKTMLDWPPLAFDFTGVHEWGELKNIEQLKHWHNNALYSTTFTQPKKYDIDTYGVPTFNEITSAEDKESCKKIYKESVHYYNLLLSESNYLLHPEENKTEIIKI